MAQIREIKKRIKSISNTKKVTHAMELVAAAKMRKSQSSALSGRPYANTLNAILEEVRKNTTLKDKLLQGNSSPNQLIILITSDRGLAGGLNINIFREVLRTEPKNPKYITVGKKALNFVAKTGGDLIVSFESEEKSQIDLAKILSKMAIEAFLSSQISKVSLLYPHYESAIKQPPMWIQVLPIKPEVLGISKEESNLKAEPPDNLLFEPSASQILNDILPHFVSTQIYQVLLEAKAAEHSARMVAMKNATDAAQDLIEDLTLTYNQVRQETITKELLDITTAQKAFD